MKEFLAQIHFAQPLFFVLLFLLPLLWLRRRNVSLLALLWRVLVFLLLVVALADPHRVSEAVKKGERIFAFDLSRSIPQGMRAWMERTAEESLAPQPGDRVLVFGGGSREVQDWERWLVGEVPDDPVKPDRTNLEALFSYLMKLPPAPRKLFLFTDGWETQGKVERLLSSLASSGLKIFPFLPPDRPHAANIAVKKILAPHLGVKGESVNLRVVVENHNPQEVEGKLVLKRNGQPFNDEAVRVKPGSQIFGYQATLPDGPMASFSANFTPSSKGSDLFSLDNEATSWVAVQAKEKVLLLNGRSGEGRHLEEILKRRGFEVTSVTVETSPPPPSGFEMVFFNNVERGKFAPEYLSALERHVAAGNAFVMLGSENSFGPGGYQGTPVETLLPVALKEPKREEKNRAVVLVIDKSGSMREEDKLLYAKEAAKAVAGQFKDKDLLGVIGFDIEPFVVVPLAPVEKIRGSFAAQVDRLKAQGRTYLFPAVLEAKRQLERQSAGRKHVIILSDGETGGSGGDYIDLVTVMKQELKITISAVAIGQEANIPLLKRIAQYGGGLFHHTYDPTTLPQIVLLDMEERSEEEPPKERNFTPSPVRGSELLAGFSAKSYPPLKGYIETETKRQARMDLVLANAERKPPLLASWSYGKGKSIAFTTDLSGQWSRDWIQWELLERFWARLLEWLRPPRESLPPHEVRMNLEGSQPVLELYLYRDEDSSALFRYSFSGKQEKGEGVLRKMAPGRYQTVLPLSLPGEYRIGLTEERNGQKISYPTLGYNLAYDPRSEVPRGEFNVGLLEELARTTGGEINPRAKEAMPAQEVVRSSMSLRAYFIFLAMALFLLEVIFRRFLLRAP